MIVKLFDRTEIVVSKEAGEKLMQSIAKSADGYVMVSGMMVRKSAIALIKPGGYTEADMPAQSASAGRLKSDNRTESEQYQSARKASDLARENLQRKGLKL